MRAKFILLMIGVWEAVLGNMEILENWKGCRERRVEKRNWIGKVNNYD